jgi:nucleoside-diphosphate-sugar epimerase
LTVKAVIAGSGYVGRRLASRLRSQGCSVTGIVRTEASAAALTDLGIEAVVDDLSSLRQPDRMAGALLFYLAPPPGSGDTDTTLDAFLTQVTPLPARFVYMSTTGVYGDCGGELVDEDRPPAPATARARRRFAAESSVRRWAAGHSVPWAILRVPGIYGPDRLGLDRLAHGEPVLRESDAPPGNRIHVDDLVTACIAAGFSTLSDRVWNVGDGNHMSSSEFQHRVAVAAALPAPPSINRAQAEHRFGERRMSFLNESRRIDNRRLLRDLEIVLAFEDPDAGIRASLPRPAMPG